MKPFIYCNLTFPALMFLCESCYAQNQIVRKELLTANLGSHAGQKVNMREINFQAKQMTGYHKHPCPVGGYFCAHQTLNDLYGFSNLNAWPH